MSVEVTFDKKTGEKNITLPRVFKANPNSPNSLNDVLETMHSINVSSLKYATPMHIDMSKVENINASAALLLFAHITSAQLVNQQGDFVRVTLPEHEPTRRLVRTSGLWDAIRSGTGRKLEKNWLTTNNFQSGYDPEKHLDLTLELLQKKWGTIPRHLSTAINEAMLNITQHAYQTNPDSAIKRWWQYIYIKDDELNFFIFDKGIGIPDSFRINKQKRFDPDNSIIEYAMQRFVTSTKTQGRGNGSFNIKRPVNDEDSDILMILSHKGGYKYVRDGNTSSFQLPSSLAGTLVAWKIGLRND